MNARSWLGVERNPWLLAIAALVVLALAISAAPLAVTLGVVVLTATAALVWRYGAVEGLWLLALAVIPLREPLSADIHGTVSVFFGDLLMFGLLVHAILTNGVRDMWRESLTFRVGLAVLALSLIGLYTASRLFWGVAAVYRILAQLATFYVARTLVRRGPQATRALFAVLIGLAPAILYGLYQASAPYDAALPDWASRLTAYGPGGEPHLRVFSTFDHTLRFSHFLTVGLGLSLGLAFSTLSIRRRALAVIIGAGAVACNLLTYALGGLVGMLAAVVSALVLNRRRRVVIPLVVALVLLIGFSPTTLTSKAERVLTGRAVTAAARLVTYKQALTIMMDHPLVGVGWGSIRSFMEEEYRMTRAHAVAFAAENYFLQRGVALGLPGIALFIVLCVLFLRNAIWPRGDPAEAAWPRAAIIVGGVAFYFQAQTFPAASAASGHLLWLLFALAEAMRESSVHVPPGPLGLRPRREPSP